METMAYNFKMFAPEAVPEQKPEVRVVRTSSKTKKALRQARLYCAVLLFLMLGLMTATVYSSMELSEIKNNIITRENTLTELQSEYAYLNFQLESQISLRSAEEYAETTLGLIKINASQVEYVNLQHENTIHISDEFSASPNLLGYLRSLVLDS